MLSYSTLIRLGHFDPATFTKRKVEEKTRRGSLVRAYISKCEKTTTYDRQKMKYSCGCPELNEEQIMEARETNKN